MPPKADVDELDSPDTGTAVREVEAEAGVARRIRVGRVERQVVLARAEDELVGQRR